jgi:hypothetical protein
MLPTGNIKGVFVKGKNNTNAAVKLKNSNPGGQPAAG